MTCSKIGGFYRTYVAFYEILLQGRGICAFALASCACNAQ